MDKFTVDLDKVLNDFEYSELTDQYVKPSQSSSYSSSRMRNGNVKHSINNVFHSLNEYLSTDIDDKCEIVTDISLKQTDTFDKPNIAKDNNLDSPVKITHVHIDLEDGDINREDLPTNVSVKEDSEETISYSILDTENLDDLVTNTTNEYLESNDLKENAKPVEKPVNNSETLKELEECRVSIDLTTKTILNETEEANKDLVNDCQNATDKIIETKEDNTCETIATDLSEETKEKTIEIGEKKTIATDLSEKTEEKTIAIGEKETAATDLSEDTKELGGKEIVATDLPEETIEKTSEVREQERIIVTDLSEENEKTIKIEKKESNVTVLSVGRNEKTFEIEEKTTEIEEETGIGEEKLLGIGSIGETNEKTIDVEEKKENVPISFSDTINLDDSELNKYLDELEEELEHNADVKTTETHSEIVEKEEIKEVESNNQKDLVKNEELEEDRCPSRPDTLTLSHTTSEEKHDINLIGAPGSTPYNNVYVSEELPKDEEIREESLSPSPTFSDVSTDTTRSTTPSTETLNDDNEVADKNVASSLQPNLSQTSITQNESPNIEEISVVTENAQALESNASSLEENRETPRSEESVGERGQSSLVQDSAGTESWIGKHAPLWIPDSDAMSCLHCDAKFTVIKRRHHCRACGLVLCSKCCNLRHRLEYLSAEARVCVKCYEILTRDSNSSSGSELSQANSPCRPAPNPNNPMEYCSMVPPLQQVSGGSSGPPTVMVPVGVLKRKGSNKGKSNKSVMFCDGIRPGSDLTSLDSDFSYNESKMPKKVDSESSKPIIKGNKNVPTLDPQTQSYIPSSESCLPPTATFYKSDITYSECGNNINVVEMLKNELLTFALQRNLYVQVKVINMDCCINKWAWCFSTDGLIHVGQDEVVILLEVMDNETTVPKDIFIHINNIYNDAVKGTTVKEFGVSLHNTSNFLGSKNHAGFLYIRPTFQCLQNVIQPKEQYLIGILIHRWETPWAKIFPLRLILRLGAEYRYYPSPIISTRQRESCFVEIGHTIINLLADFRNFSYTLPQIRGLIIHMEDKNTTITIPRNRYDQVMRSINNSSDHILAFGGHFSTKADSHLVCIQDVHGNTENAYSTHAINIQNRPRKITGASFIVFNGALKSSSGLTAKSSIVEDGLMIQVPPENMDKIRDSLRNMKNYTIQCGCVNAPSDETVNIVWGEPDANFNIGVASPIDNQSMSGIPSIRVHNGKDFVCSSGSRLLRWTEVFIMENGEENSRTQDAVDISKISESIAKATCQALIKYLDLLASNNFYKVGLRATLHVDNVQYSAGSNGITLPPIYMKKLDNELIPVMHRIVSNGLGENAIVLELIFRILNL